MLTKTNKRDGCIKSALESLSVTSKKERGSKTSRIPCLTASPTVNLKISSGRLSQQNYSTSLMLMATPPLGASFCFKMVLLVTFRVEMT